MTATTASKAAGWRWLALLLIVVVPVQIAIASPPALPLDLELRLIVALLPGYLLWLWFLRRSCPATAGWLLPLLVLDAGLAWLLWQVVASALADFDILPPYSLYWLEGTGYWEYAGAYVQPAILGVWAAGAAGLAVPALTGVANIQPKLAATLHAMLTTLLSLAAAVHLAAFLIRSGATPARWVAAVASVAVFVGAAFLLSRTVMALARGGPSGSRLPGAAP